MMLDRLDQLAHGFWGANVTYIRSYLAPPIQTDLNTLDPQGRRKDSSRLVDCVSVRIGVVAAPFERHKIRRIAATATPPVPHPVRRDHGRAGTQ